MAKWIKMVRLVFLTIWNEVVDAKADLDTTTAPSTSIRQTQRGRPPQHGHVPRGDLLASARRPYDP